MDFVSISAAFALGFIARRIGLPPLVGFLAAGFVLRAGGATGGPALWQIAEFGVLLLLFTIGLKLRIGSLLKPKVWAGASIHMLITVGVVGPVIFGVGLLGLTFFDALNFRLALLIAFALSFSSTVFAVKVLEEKSEMASLHGRVAIGILIIQDVIAVLFLTISKGELPSIWAFALLALFPLRPLIGAVMQRCGHGELLILFGLFVALAGAESFELVGLKPDLGALVLGMLLAPHAKAEELSRSLMGFKDLFLVGFFLTIGLQGSPSFAALGIALLLVVLMPFKFALLFILLTRFRLRARTGLLASLSLANYSEFGLIVAYVGVGKGWIDSDWLVILAIALSITFVAAAPLNTAAHAIYARFDAFLKAFEARGRHPDDEPIDPGEAEIFVFGMGRIGTGAYDAMRTRYGENVLGLDHDEGTVRKHLQAGRNVIRDDATDPDFWQRIRPDRIRLVMLAMPNQTQNIYIAQQLGASSFSGRLAATVSFADDKRALQEAGVDTVFNFYDEAGANFAEHVHERLAAWEAGGPASGLRSKSSG